MFTWFYCLNPSQNSWFLLVIYITWGLDQFSIQFLLLHLRIGWCQHLGSMERNTNPKVEDGTWKWWFLKKWIHPGNYMGLCLSYKYDILHIRIFLFMGSIFRFHVTFFGRVGCVGGYICFTRRYGLPKDPKFLPRNGIICACDTLRILRHLLRMVYQAFGSRSDTPCFTF